MQQNPTYFLKIKEVNVHGLQMETKKHHLKAME